MKKIIYAFLILLLAGCVTYKPLIDKNYQGETAVIADTYEPQGRGYANFYYVSSYNENPVINAINTTETASQGKGAVIHARGASRKIKTDKARFKLVGQVHHSAPIGYLLNADENYIVAGEIDFSPEPSQTYLVKGYLSKAYSAVWIEDIAGSIVSDIVEELGSDLDQAQSVKNSVFAKHKLAKKDSKLAILSNIKSGETKEIVELKLGKPDSVSEIESNFFSGRPAKTVFQYEQIGTVTFVTGPTLYVESISPMVQSALVDTSELGYQLKTYESDRLQHFAKSLYSKNLTDITSLDMIAARIWISRETENDIEIDALSWLCKALGRSQNGRYSTFLTELSKSAGSKKLKKYALANLKMLPNADSEQFDVSNAEL